MVGGKKLSQKRGGGNNDRIGQYIPLINFQIIIDYAFVYASEKYSQSKILKQTLRILHNQPVIEKINKEINVINLFVTIRNRLFRMIYFIL